MSGLTPTDLPAIASVSPTARIWGQAWLVAIAFGVLCGLGVVLLERARRPHTSGTPDMLAIHSLVAMSQVAIADSRIDEAEVHHIANILTRLTVRSYAAQQVTDMLKKLNPSSSDIEQVGQDLSDKDRQIVLKAALNIAAAYGGIHPNELAVVSELAQRMRIGADQFRFALARISAHLQIVQTT